jgi:deoxyribonuclease-4
MTVARAVASGGNSLQLFTAIPKFYGDKSNIKPDRVRRFHEATAEYGIDRDNVIVHAAYVLNVATPKADQWARACAGLAKEMERSTLLGVRGTCFHPGSAGDSDPQDAVRRIAEAMIVAIEHTPDSRTRVLVENTAGAGRTMGRTAREVSDILGHIPPNYRSRAGYGLDTCHLYASGYDLTESAARLRSILDEFQEATGEAPAFFHLNDSDGALGSNRDRHALLGQGAIGIEPFRWLLADERTADVPLILETPTANPEIAGDDASADTNDEAMIRLVRELVA